LSPLETIEGWTGNRKSGTNADPDRQVAFLPVIAFQSRSTRIHGTPDEARLTIAPERQGDAGDIPDKHLGLRVQAGKGGDKEGKKWRIEIKPASRVGDLIRIAAVEKSRAGLGEDREIRAMGLGLPPHDLSSMLNVYIVKYGQRNDGDDCHVGELDAITR
jgi:hypothetical protein